MSSSTHTLQGFAKIVGKGHGHLPAIPVIGECRLRLLEVDIAFGFVGIEDIADGQLKTALILDRKSTRLNSSHIP